MARITHAESKFYGLGDVLKLFPVSRTTFYTMLKNGTFPAGKKIAPRIVLWSKEEVDLFISSKLK